MCPIKHIDFAAYVKQENPLFDGKSERKVSVLESGEGSSEVNNARQFRCIRIVLSVDCQRKMPLQSPLLLRNREGL